jgi:hypothetical protein
MLKNINAVQDPWVPVMTSKEIRLVSLLEIFDSSAGCVALSEGLWGSLPYLNLLIAIATDACRPQTVSDIQAYLDNPDKFAARVRRYLVTLLDRFDLFGKNPFLQAGCYDFATLRTSKPEHIRDALDMLATEGATTTELRDSRIPEVADGALILQLLLKSLVYGGNKKTLIPSSIRPNLIDALGNVVGTITEGQPAVSPIRTTNSGSSGTLNIYVQGSSLIRTIILNLIPENEVCTIWRSGFGKPIYLQDTNDHTKMVAKHKSLDASFLGHLVPLTKYLRILTDAEAAAKGMDTGRVWMVYNHATAYNFQEALQNLKTAGVTDTTYYAALSNPKAKYTRGILRPNAYLWKELAEISLKQIPKVLTKFSQLTVPDLVTIVAVGMEGSGSAGLVYNEQLSESFLSLSGDDLTKYVTGSDAFDRLHNIGAVSMEISSQMFFAVLTYAKELFGESCDCDPYTESASRAYWSRLSTIAQVFISKVMAGDPAAAQEWRMCCRDTARSIILDVKDGSVRRNKAVTRALKKII